MSDVTTMASIESRSSYGGDPFGGNDDKLHVEFVSHPIVLEGGEQPLWGTADYVKIQHRGEKDLILRPASDADKRRFSRQWKAYQAGETIAPEGTPLAVLFPRNPEIVESLKSDKIITIEQLAGLTDTQIQNVGLGGRMFTDRAKAHLAASKDARVASTDERIRKLEEDLEASKKGFKR